MIVKCIDASGCDLPGRITVGKFYDVIHENGKDYLIMDDKKETSSWLRNRFEVVVVSEPQFDAEKYANKLFEEYEKTRIYYAKCEDSTTLAYIDGFFSGIEIALFHLGYKISKNQTVTFVNKLEKR